jgi:hypothetical protein
MPDQKALKPEDFPIHTKQSEIITDTGKPVAEACDETAEDVAGRLNKKIAGLSVNRLLFHLDGPNSSAEANRPLNLRRCGKSRRTQPRATLMTVRCRRVNSTTDAEATSAVETVAEDAPYEKLPILSKKDLPFRMAERASRPLRGRA